MSKVWMDGELVEKTSAKLSLFDHGFQHGDGVCEGMRLYSGQVFLLEEHLQQLLNNAAYLRLKIPHTLPELANIVQQAINGNQRQEGYIRVILTRGPGTLALDPRKCEPSLFVIVDEIGLYPRELTEAGMHVTCLEVTEPLPRSGLLGKSALVPLRYQALDAGFCEALLIEADHIVGAIEGVPFLKFPEGWITPPETASCADPVYRQLGLKLLQECGELVRSLRVLKAQLTEVQEAFLICAASGVVPIDSIEVLLPTLPVGPGTEQVRRLFLEAVRGS